MKIFLTKYRWLCLSLFFLGIILGVYLLTDRASNNLVVEKVVYIRNIEKQNFSYYATIDDVGMLLADYSDQELNTRDFSFLQKLVLANKVQIKLLNQSKTISVSDFQELFEIEPAYTNKVFTVGIQQSEIISIKEESLE